jgi:hypothetical protein
MIEPGWIPHRSVQIVPYSPAGHQGLAEVAIVRAVDSHLQWTAARERFFLAPM